MNPDDTLQASEEGEAEGEEAILARGLQHSRHAKKFGNTYLTHLPPIVVWTLSEREGNEPSALLQ